MTDSAWTKKVVRCLFLLVVSLYAVFMLGLIGCGDDDTGWSGTWALATVDGESPERIIGADGDLIVSITTNKWTFDSDGTMQAEVGYKFQGQERGAAVTGTISTKFNGTYFLSGFDYTLSMSILTVGQTITAAGVENIQETDTDEDTGTWSRTGDTLILTSDYDDDLVFVKL